MLSLDVLPLVSQQVVSDTRDLLAQDGWSPAQRATLEARLAGYEHEARALNALVATSQAMQATMEAAGQSVDLTQLPTPIPVPTYQAVPVGVLSRFHDPEIQNVHVTSAWQDFLGDTFVLVYGGSEQATPGQGVVVVIDGNGQVALHKNP
ncbi:MAG: hypothetical protein HC893_13200 [Chloroflexaceae bacterium]|nr:hypothetical protein [Chloroflexaceae bacterium]